MSSAESAARARGLLAERVAAAADAVAAVPGRLPALFDRPRDLPRRLVTTGIGTSEGHARHLAEVASRWLGWPARFAETGSLADAPPPGAEHDWLVLFSQGLSANACHALRHVSAWGGVVVVTGLPHPATSEAVDLDPDKRRWLEILAASGAVQVDMGCGPESGLLVRVIGARVGYAIGWSLLRTLAARRLEDPEALAVAPDRLHAAQHAASDRAGRVFVEDGSLEDFFDPGRALLLVGEGGTTEMLQQLSLKISEGWLRPQPRIVDVLGFAHGPLQSHHGRPASILYLAGRAAPAGAGAEDAHEGSGEEGGGEWLARLRAGLDPEHHRLRVLSSSLDWPFAILQYEAMLDALLLRTLDRRESDPARWPGADREGALYHREPDPLTEGAEAEGPRPQGSRSVERSSPLEEAVWPEIEARLARGGGLALLPLGSTEQHGPHLPFGTDSWFAAALAEHLAVRLEGAIALPPIAFGCASEHLDFPGTLHVEPATLEALLADLLSSLVGHGFRAAFVFSAHGGNIEALASMQARLARKAAPLALHVDLDLSEVARLQRHAVEAAGLDPAVAGSHAGEYETSLVAGLRPGAVRWQSLGPGRLAAPGEAQSLFYPSLRANAPDGVVGDPTAARAERAPAYLEAWVDRLEQVWRTSEAAVLYGSTEAEPGDAGGAEKNRQSTKGIQKA